MSNAKVANQKQERNIETKRRRLRMRIEAGEITIGEIYCIKQLLGLDNEELCKLLKI